MVRTATLLLLVAAFVAASGCITPLDQGDMDDGDIRFNGPVIMSGTFTASSAVNGPQVLAQETVVASLTTIETPETVRTLSASVVWTMDQNAFKLRVTTPSGETVTQEPSAARTIEYRPDSPIPGTYTFETVASGVVMQDTVSLEGDLTWLQSAGNVSSEDLISFRKEGDKWVATIVFSTKATAIDDLALDVDTFNGAIKIAKRGNETIGKLTTWARADTQERAAELVRALDVRFGIHSDTLTAHADDATQRSGSESTGASLDLSVAGRVHGTVDTSNGGITLTDLETGALTADTSNGRIQGKLTSAGDLDISTSNGRIELHVVPTATQTLSLDTSNGDVDLTLEESDDTGYRLTTDTSNGKVREEMSEASLSGGDDEEKTLETDDYASRAVQVSGSVDTSNGDITFRGA